MRKLRLFSVVVLLFFVATLLYVVPNVYAFYFDGVETQVTTDPYDQFDPDMSGSYAVYTDRRGADADIYLYDFETGVETQVSSGGGDQYFNDVSGNLVVYTDYGLGNAEIFLYNIETRVTQQLTNHPANQLRPAVSGNLVVYEDNRNGAIDVYLLNITTMVETRLTTDPGHQRRPDISGSTVVWEDYRNGNPDIYMYDLGSTIESPVGIDPAQDREPSVDGDIVAYDSTRSSPGDIYYYRISTGETVAVTSSVDLERNAALSGNYIAYESYGGGDADIWIYNIALDVSALATVSSAEQYLHDISGNRVVYTDDRNGNLDIYAFEFTFGDPDIEVSPLFYDFGSVELGETSTMIVTISNIGDADLRVEEIYYTTPGLNEFIVEAPEPTPFFIAPGETRDVLITYMPLHIGDSYAVLSIFSNDAEGDVAQVELLGRGVEAELPPEEQIQAIIDQFDEWVDSGALVGEGPGNSAANRLNALRNMLEAAGDLIEDGNYLGACGQLNAAYKKCDGQPRPPDFVAGPAADDLAQMIQDLRADLGCE